MANQFDYLAECSWCNRAFNETERLPKVLPCQHYFCLSCLRGEADPDVFCSYCCTRTALPVGPAALPTLAPALGVVRGRTPAPLCGIHNLPVLWCTACRVLACLSCDHAHHAYAMRSLHEAQTLLERETRFFQCDINKLIIKKRDFLLRVRDATTDLQGRIEAELCTLHPAPYAGSVADFEYHSLAAATAECERLRKSHADLAWQCRTYDIISSSTVLLDLDMFQRNLCEINSMNSLEERHDPLLFLANHLTAQLFLRDCMINRCQVLEFSNTPGLDGEAVTESRSTAPLYYAVGSPLLRNPSTYPLFVFNIDVNSAPFGRFVIEVRDDVAPLMAQNFAVLCTGELGFGYKGCKIFQCWENQSVITGDYQMNNGRGGRSIYEEFFFMPDNTKMVAIRGAVGMRRAQKRYDNSCQVGSQFRIVLQEMRCFTAIFGYVVEGLELIDRISQLGDSAGKPQSTIIISSCEKIN
ncbi:uncharacterized protein LOC126979000 [Leptidea sinapis]|uniref:uncharacterized protein LOC126979000 n=1 Tax=Leptidea sinapis TaxID=189913 RepID=UPI0021C4C0EE|nr:uncharacterized protein LOC126979000 [Leptidea sinapis]